MVDRPTTLVVIISTMSKPMTPTAPLTERPVKLSGSISLRIYETDADEIRKLNEDVYRDTKLTQIDIIRDSVHAGLPLIIQRLRSIVKQ